MRNTVKESSAPVPHRSRRWSAAVATLVGAVSLLGVPALAEGASSVGPGNSSHTTDPWSAPGCTKVSASSVSSIVGYTVPKGKFSILDLKATPANFETSSVDSTCVYGAEATTAELDKVVSLVSAVFSKPLTPAEIKASIKKAAESVKLTFSSYAGLSDPAYYMSFSVSSFHLQEIVLVASSTHYYGAAVDTLSLSKAKLAALAQLAANL
jgi:hypothetical protein